MLLLVCAAILWFHLRQRPVGSGAGLIGLAACLGDTAVFGLGRDAGATRFTSLLAACAAFPLLRDQACAGRMRRWPRGAAVGRFVLVVGASASC